MKPFRRPRALRHGDAGYTLVELMMALALLTVAVLGIISLQKLMIVSNAHAKNMSVAERVAQSWAAQLQMDSTAWRGTTAGTDWLGTGLGGGWIRPAYVAGGKNFGAAFDALGNPLPDTALARARYCTHVRLTTLYPSTGLVTGNGMVRAEIRVFWLRDGESDLVAAGGTCPVAQDEDAIGQATDRYHFVYHTTGLRQHSSS
jgi:prepilin-type N-terminal cleavage/methylation domain-containing protein